MPISEEELREGDRPTRVPRCITCRETIIGKSYPGPRCLRCWDEVTDPDA